MAQKTELIIDKSWEFLFGEYDICNKVIKNGYFKITSSEINKVKEARLMAKFDQSTQLPEIFKKNNLSILPITRGEYIIGPFKTHERINYPKIKPEKVEIPDLQTLDYKNLYSESSALLFAYNSGIIKNFMESDEINFTVNGRMSSGEFEYNINTINGLNKTHKINVKNAQVEIDGGYESSNLFCICEAKNIAVDDILIRQLYYPYRLWTNKIKKPILPVFLIFSNDIFHMFLYKFTNDFNYNSLELLKYKTYTFDNEEITLDEIIDIWKNTKPITEPIITFPQADNFTRIIDLLSILNEKSLTRDEITYIYDFDGRQTNYYISACEYLDLIIRTNNSEGIRVYELTKDAKKIMNSKHKQKYMKLTKRILERPIFNKIFELTINKNFDIPSRNDISEIMKFNNLNINQTTIYRRASTVRSWIDWIIRQGE